MGFRFGERENPSPVFLLRKKSGVSCKFKVGEREGYTLILTFSRQGRRRLWWAQNGRSIGCLLAFRYFNPIWIKGEWSCMNSGGARYPVRCGELWHEARNGRAKNNRHPNRYGESRHMGMTVQATSVRQDFAGVQDVMGVEGHFDAPHQSDLLR
jgi:hypothetical protein